MTIPWWAGKAKSKAIVKTKATPKVDANVKDHDIAPGNSLVGE